MAKLVVRKLGIDVASVELGYGEEYLVGRSPECAIILEESKGISRQHLKVSVESGAWVVELLSKYGVLIHEGVKIDRIELEHETTFSVPPYEFLFLDARVQSEEEAEVKVAESENSLIVRQATTVSPFNPLQPTGSRPGQDATDSGQRGLIPVLKMSFADRSKDEIVRLEGNIWVAGRDLNCEITIDDHHVSRQHFELSRVDDGFCVTDLGSANGTSVNGQRLKAHEPMTLQSGDHISIMDVNIEFELRDPQFEKRLALATQSLPPLETFSASTPMDHGPHPDYNYPLLTPHKEGPAVIKVQKKQQRGFDTASLKDPEFYRRHKIRIVIGLLLCFVVYGLISEDPKKVDKTEVASTGVVNFDQLTPEKKTAVKDSFQLATNLYVQGKYELCISELQKLHNILPHYDNSKELQTFCEQGSILVRKKRDMERLDAEKENIERQIQIIADDCKAKVNAKATSEEIQHCLGPAIELDPEHYRIIEVLQAIESIEMQRRDKASQEAQYQQRVREGKSHFAKAQKLQKNGRLAAALEEYKRFLNASYPSLSKEEEIASREVASVKKELDVKVSSLIGKCKSEKTEGKYKQAYLSCEQAEKEDPGNSDAQREMRAAESELKRIMKAIYEDSILEESLGNVDAAKEKWKKIVEDDLKGAEYYEKSRRKLQKYGLEM